VVLLVLLVLPVLRVSRVFAVKAENLVPLVLPVVLDPVVFLDFLAKMYSRIFTTTFTFDLNISCHVQLVG